MTDNYAALAAFLLARIAEDEADARKVTFEAVSASDFEWSGWYQVDYWGEETRQHGSRWSPARVLAECDAKRRIVAMDTDDPSGFADGYYQAQYEAMQFLALPDADHPDYRPEWAA